MNGMVIIELWLHPISVHLLAINLHPYSQCTVNVDIFAGISFYGFAKKFNFADLLKSVISRGFPKFDTLVQYCINFQFVHIFADF